jgi:hypothetical protein
MKGFEETQGSKSLMKLGLNLTNCHFYKTASQLQIHID